MQGTDEIKEADIRNRSLPLYKSIYTISITNIKILLYYYKISLTHYVVQ